MIVLFTDFGLADPYVGQMRMVLAQHAPEEAVIDLCHCAPQFDIKAAAYLLGALARQIPKRAICVGVVDPGVGGERAAIMVHADERWFVGPDNGLFAVIMRRAHKYDCYRIEWRPSQLSASFHGRDVFAPVAAMLSQGTRPEHTPYPVDIGAEDWPQDWHRIIYLDHYGNAMTGIRSQLLSTEDRLQIHGHALRYARTFSEADDQQPFWYPNSVGLAEIAVNRSSAAESLGLAIGEEVRVLRAG